MVTAFDGDERSKLGPPDTTIAAGPTDIVELTNLHMDVWSRTSPHRLLYQQYICYSFETTMCGDPRVMYDPSSKRFFAAMVTATPGAADYDGITVAVSATSDPTGTWYHHTIAKTVVDMPRLAVTTDKVIIGDNGDDVWILQKSDLVAAKTEPVAARTTHFLAVPEDERGAEYGSTTVEAGTADGPDGYTMSRGGTDTTGAYLNRITGTPAAGDVKLTPTVLHVPYPWQDPTPAVQEGGPDTIPDDFYPTQATVRAGSLWYSMTEPCTPPGDTARHDCIHLVQIDVSASVARLVQEVEIGVAGEDLIVPQVEVDNQGRAVVVATESGADMHPSVVATLVRADGQVGTPTVLRAGQTYTTTDQYEPGHIRWGDYSAAAVDPIDPSKLWLGGEFALNESQWGTSISEVDVTDTGCTSAAACAPGTYRALTPTRLLDTRSGMGAARHPVVAGGVVNLSVAGHGGIPSSGVAAVAVNLTTTDATTGGYLRAWGDGLPEPATSNLNFAPGQSTAATAIVPVGAGGRIALRNGSSGTVDLIADVTGYYLSGRATTPGSYSPLPPARLLDTRAGTGATKRAVPAGGTVRLHVAGVAGLPASGLSATALTVTVTAPQHSGYLSAYADGHTRPATSILNFPAGRTVANAALTQIGSDGYLDLYNGSTGTVQLVVDVTGYYQAGTATATGAYTPTTPTRILDTRTGHGANSLAAGASITLHVAGTNSVPATATSAAINLTVSHPASGGYLTIYPIGTTRPATSTLNFTTDQTVANLAITKLGTNGTVTISNSAHTSVNVIADLTGYTR